MSGMILAVQLALTSALIVAFGVWARKDARKTPKARDDHFVTSEQLELALEEHRKALEWEWTEMYDKFNKLHLRLAKREKRKPTTEQQVEQEELESEHFGARHRSVLPFRKFGSP